MHAVSYRCGPALFAIAAIRDLNLATLLGSGAELRNLLAGKDLRHSKDGSDGNGELTTGHYSDTLSPTTTASGIIVTLSDPVGFCVHFRR